MSVKRISKKDIDLRMNNVVVQAGGGAWFPEEDIQRLDSRNLPYYIDELRKGEAQTRRLRKRLEALQSGSSRTCPHCGRPVAGRTDKVYCTTECRVRAHRGSAIGKADTP